MLQYETPKYFKLFYLLVLCAKSCVKPYHPHDFFIISFSVHNSLLVFTHNWVNFFTCWKDIKTMSKILHCLINERFSTFYVILRILKAKNILLYYILLTNVKFHRLFMAQVARPFFVLDFCQISC